MRRGLPILLLFAAAALAHDQSPPARSTPAADDPLTGAKREFDTVKSERGVNEPAKPVVPTFTAPEFSLGSAMPQSTKQKKTPAELLAEKKSANWLVDAMMKPDDKAGKNEKADLAETKLLEQKINPDVMQRAASLKPEDEKAPTKPEPAKTGPEFNPLTRYMSGWMTPQDYSLLKPGLGGASADSMVARGEASFTVPTSDLAVMADKNTAVDLMGLSHAAPPAAIVPTVNPYLQSFMPPPQSLASFVAPAAASPVPPPVNVFTPPPDATATKSRTPDFAKPATDEKYFKQLKRF